ncbi:MAG: glutamine--fructose-6-phosphate transaminase (isomerizing) [Hyphomicrobiales bacterium]
MCGIVGILGTKDVAVDILDALKRLEYRGYDSAGVATLTNGVIDRRRAAGKLGNLASELSASPLSGTSGIGHTRWATHGAATTANAHPHKAGRVAIVHNGIIENFRELKEELAASGTGFETETDTEVVAHLMTRALENGDSIKDAVSNTLKRLEGAFAFAILFDGEEDLMVAARQGSPLAIGHGEGESYIGSDAIALAPFTNKVTYLEDGDWAILTRSSMEIYDSDGNPAERGVSFTQVSGALVDKGNHRHFMAKEIAEQPEVVGHTISEYVDMATGKTRILDDLPIDFSNLSRLTITACGTAFYAALAAKYWFEQLARLPVEVDVASEFRYREAPLPEGGLSLVISQSGETADTLAALRYCKSQGQQTVGVVNVRESTIAREADFVVPTIAGPEIGVASTKAFTCQLTVLAVLAIAVARARGAIDAAKEQELVSAMLETPRHMVEILHQEEHIARIAQKVSSARDVLYLGRGVNFPIALEGALKLKELSYIHAEGYAAGELKHGPIALIDDEVPVVVIAPRDELYDKTISNMEEVAARGGKIVLISNEAGNGNGQFDQVLVPKAHSFINPLLYAVPVQLIAYHAAVFMGTDVDQPRNLAKSVTVE